MKEMPSFKAIQPLLNICLENVTQNMDSLWCKHYMDHYGEDRKFYRYVLGPFESIPSKLLVLILQSLKEENRLRRHYLELLITPQLEHLDLSRESEDVSYPLQLAVTRCQLRTVNLSGCQKIPKQVYQEFFPLLERLRVLDVSQTKSGDSCLYILGAYCVELRELDITNCPVTDDGIRGLCVSKDDLGRPSSRLGQCKLIVKLVINYTKISSLGIQCALENLQGLKVLDCCSSVQVLAEMHQDAYQNQLPDIPQYQLIDLHCTNDSFTELPYRSGSLAAAVSLCSQLLKLNIVTLEGLTDGDLSALTGLGKLREFTIGASEVCQVSFPGGILPLLQSFGNSLQRLTIAEFPKVNVRAITEYCPNLRSIELLMNADYDSHWVEEKRKPPTVPGLKQLETLQIVGHEDDSVPEKHLLLLLSSPCLVHIYLKDCSTLVDDNFRKAFAVHQFANLQHLELEQCHCLNPQSIDPLLNSSNPLKKLLLWQCRLLTRQTVTNWSRKTLKKKWKVSVEWT